MQFTDEIGVLKAKTKKRKVNFTLICTFITQPKTIFNYRAIEICFSFLMLLIIRQS